MMDRFDDVKLGDEVCLVWFMYDSTKFTPTRVTRTTATRFEVDAHGGAFRKVDGREVGDQYSSFSIWPMNDKTIAAMEREANVRRIQELRRTLSRTTARLSDLALLEQIAALLVGNGVELL
jgi:hypothetical protein